MKRDRNDYSTSQSSGPLAAVGWGCGGLGRAQRGPTRVAKLSDLVCIYLYSAPHLILGLHVAAVWTVAAVWFTQQNGSSRPEVLLWEEI